MGFYGSKYRDVIYDVPITEARMINDIELELMNEAVTLDILDEEAKFNFLPKFKDRKELRGVYKDLKDAQDTLNYAGEYDAAYGKKAGSLALRILDKVAAIGSFAAAGAGVAVVGTGSLAVGLVIAIPVYLLTRVVQWAVKNKKEDEAKGMVEEAIGKLENLKSSGDEDDAAKIDALINKLKDKLHKLETSKKDLKKEEKVEKKIEKAAKKEEKQAIKDAKKLMKAEKKANVKKPEEIDDDPDEDLVDESAIEESGDCEKGVCPEHILDAIDKFASDDQVDAEQIKEECDLDSCAENIEDETEKLKKTDEFEIEDEEHPLEEQYTSMLEFMVSNGISLNEDQLEALKEEYLIEATDAEKSRRKLIADIRKKVQRVFAEEGIKLFLQETPNSKKFRKGMQDTFNLRFDFESKGLRIAAGILSYGQSELNRAFSSGTSLSRADQEAVGDFIETSRDEIEDAVVEAGNDSGFDAELVHISLNGIKVKAVLATTGPKALEVRKSSKKEDKEEKKEFKQSLKDLKQQEKEEKKKNK